MPVYGFGPFRLDPARRELSRDGVPIDLPPKAFDVIVYLLEHRDRAVGRDELIAGVWGRVDVSDNLLDQIVLRARRALDDRGEARQYIATRPRFGFAWAAPVTVETIVAAAEAASREGVADEASNPQTATVAQTIERPAQAPPPIASSRSKSGIAFLAVAIAVAIFAWWQWPQATRDAASETAPIAIADGATLVLPFAIAPEANAEWARLGLMDLVAHRLRDAGIETVPSDNAVALMRGVTLLPADDTALRDTAQRAGAANIVGGRVEFVAGQWKVALRLLGSDGLPIDADAQAAQPLDAARAAADRLAVALGRLPAGVALPTDAALALRLQQIDAAVLGDALDVAQRLLDDLPAEQREQPAVRMRAATLQFRRGDLDAAASAFEALLADVPASDDPHLRGTVLSGLGNLALRRGDAAAAEQRGEQAIALLAALPPSSELGRAYTGRAISRSTQGRYEPALEDFAQARIVLDSVGDRLGVARVDLNLGILDARRDRYAEAEPRLAAGADRLAAFNDLTNELFARVTLAQVRLGLLDPAAALSGEERLAQIVAREPNAERRRYANLTRAEVLAANGRLLDASALLASVREDAGAEGDIALLGWAQSLAARWALADDPAAAARDAQVALNAPWEDEGPRRFAETWRVLVQARLALGETDAAQASLAGFEAWAARKADATVDASLWLTRAEVAAARGEIEQAGAAYAQALTAAEASRIPAELLQVASSYAPWLISQGDPARATAVAGRGAAWAQNDYGAALTMARLHRALGNDGAARSALAQADRLAGQRRLPDDLAGANVMISNK
jgi:DNA-binding winged helix-turn-helix (wHTH) protein/tetratricopeptide (TPR) repeat protein